MELLDQEIWGLTWLCESKKWGISLSAYLLTPEWKAPFQAKFEFRRADNKINWKINCLHGTVVWQSPEVSKFLAVWKVEQANGVIGWNRTGHNWSFFSGDGRNGASVALENRAWTTNI